MRLARGHSGLKNIIGDLRNIGFYDNDDFIEMVKSRDRREIIRKYFMKRKSSQLLGLFVVASTFTYLDRQHDTIYILQNMMGIEAIGITLYQHYSAKKLKKVIKELSRSKYSENAEYQDMRKLWEAI